MVAAINEGQYAALPNGTRLHYVTAGDKGRPLMLFLHGFPEFWFAWQAQLAEFGQDYFAVAPDLRGFNLSDSPADVAAYKPRLIMQDITQLIAHLGYTRCVMVAHDWGGAVAWNIAITHPELLSKLIIINATHPYPFAQGLVHDPAQQAASAYMNVLIRPDAEALLAEDDYRRLWALFAGMGAVDGPHAWLTDAIKDQYRAVWAAGLRGPLNYYRASPLRPPRPGDPAAAAVTLPPGMLQVTLPTLVLWGTGDTALLPELLDGLEAFVPQLKLERMDAATHWIVHEQPALVQARLAAFLR